MASASARRAMRVISAVTATVATTRDQQQRARAAAFRAHAAASAASRRPLAEYTYISVPGSMPPMRPGNPEAHAREPEPLVSRLNGNAGESGAATRSCVPRRPRRGRWRRSADAGDAALDLVRARWRAIRRPAAAEHGRDEPRWPCPWPGRDRAGGEVSSEAGTKATRLRVAAMNTSGPHTPSPSTHGEAGASPEPTSEQHQRRAPARAAAMRPTGTLERLAVLGSSERSRSSSTCPRCSRSSARRRPPARALAPRGRPRRTRSSVRAERQLEHLVEVQS